MNAILEPPIFFLRSLGRCLPGLTDVVIEVEALKQRVEIEEALLGIRLKQKCFVALAERCPEAVVTSAVVCSAAVIDAPLQRSTKCSIKIFPGAVGSPIQIQPGSSTGTSLAPEILSRDSVGNNSGDQRTGAFNFYPKGRYNP